MKIFSPLYKRVMQWARHQYADRYLAGLSFAESSFFPIPPDVMLAPMALAKPQKAIYYAWLTTIASVAGGILGYAIGMLFFDWIEPIFSEGGRWADKYELAKQWFEQWGVWVVFIAGFSPIPYKIFTISAGVLSMAFIPFVIASTIGRGARFFLVALLMKWGGKEMEQKLEKSVDILGWIVIFVGILIYLIYK